MTKIALPMDDGGKKYEKEFIVLEPADYTFVIANRPKIEKAKSGDNNIVKMELEIENSEGEKTKVFDNLLSPDNEKGQWKWYQFLRSLGYTKEQIGSGIDLDDLYQLSGTVKIATEIQKQGSNAGEPRNVVKRYLYEKDGSDATSSPDA